MSTVRITVTELTFPQQLEDAFCRFRPLISLSYINSSGQPVIARAALPGIGERDFWDCELKHKKDLEVYVRDDNAPKVDMKKLNVKKRQVMFENLDVRSFERIDVEVFDIDTIPGWRKTLEVVLQNLPKEALLALQPEVPAALMIVKAAVEKQSGKKLLDLEGDLLDKLIGKKDKVARSIWLSTGQDLSNPPEATVRLTGAGRKGEYALSMKIEIF